LEIGLFHHAQLTRGQGFQPYPGQPEPPYYRRFGGAEQRTTTAGTSEGPVAVGHCRRQQPVAVGRQSAPFVGNITGPELHVLGVLSAQLFRGRERMDRISVAELESVGEGLHIGDSGVCFPIRCKMPAISGGFLGGLPECNHDGGPNSLGVRSPDRT
jgi:hypothetical protein